MSGTPIRVAVVDDDRSVRNALKRLLKAAGFDAGVFASGREFLAVVQEWLPDCLIVDLNMPGMNGRELLRKVLERIPSLPVIFMTAVDDPEGRAADDGLGATAYLLKPASEQDLLAAIGAALKIVVRDEELDQSPIESGAPRDA